MRHTYLELRCLISRKISFDRLHVHIWGPVHRHRTKVSAMALSRAVRTVRSGRQGFRLLYQVPDSRSKRSTSPSFNLRFRLRNHTSVSTTERWLPLPSWYLTLHGDFSDFCPTGRSGNVDLYNLTAFVRFTPNRHFEIIPPHFLRSPPLRRHLSPHCALGVSRRESVSRVIKTRLLLYCNTSQQ